MPDLALRNHAAKILTHIATDIGTEQTCQEQYAKSRGISLARDGESAASTYASLACGLIFSGPAYSEKEHHLRPLLQCRRRFYVACEVPD